MSKQSAGILLYRLKASELQVFLVHPGGPFWAKKDDGAWSIPKGEFNEGENALIAAKREFMEETGYSISGNFVGLHSIKQKGGKIVIAFAVEGDVDAASIKSNEFEMEWPPKSGKRKAFAEIDRAVWFDIDEARKKILESQLPLLNELEKIAIENK